MTSCSMTQHQTPLPKADKTMIHPRTIQTRSPRTGLNVLVLVAFVMFSLFKSIFLLIEYAGPGGTGTGRDLHLLAFQGVANIAFTLGAVLALLGLLDREPPRSWRLTAAAVFAAAIGFALLFIEVHTVSAPPVAGRPS